MDKICPRCNGHKIFENFKHVAEGVCFECSGKGTVTEEEYQRIEKEIARSMKRKNTMEANSRKKLIDSLKKKWFNNNDIIYVLNNNNTYSIKEQLQNDGAKFNYDFKCWYYTELKENTFSILWEEVLNDDSKGLAVNLRKLIQEKSNNNLKGY